MWFDYPRSMLHWNQNNTIKKWTKRWTYQLIIMKQKYTLQAYKDHKHILTWWLFLHGTNMKLVYKLTLDFYPIMPINVYKTFKILYHAYILKRSNLTQPQMTLSGLLMEDGPDKWSGLVTEPTKCTGLSQQRTCEEHLFSLKCAVIRERWTVCHAPKNKTSRTPMARTTMVKNVGRKTESITSPKFIEIFLGLLAAIPENFH